MSKRGSVGPQGEKDNPYPQNSGSDMEEAPQRATAAQLANRKIKSLKTRRTPSAPSGLSQGANFGQPQQANAFNFGGAQQSGGAANSNPFAFGSGAQNGGTFGTTNSFPPAQGSTPSANFSNSSFPAFGAGSGAGGETGTGFNFNPPSSSAFNFSAGGGTNPFTSNTNSAPAVNGTANSGFSGSIFNVPASQPQTNNTNNVFNSATSGLNSQNNALSSTTPQKPQSTNFFGTNTSTTPFGQPPAKNLFGSGDDAMHTSPDNSPSKNNTNSVAKTSLAQTTAPTLFSTIKPQQAEGSKVDSAPTNTSTPAPAGGMFGQLSQSQAANKDATPQLNSTSGQSKPANPFSNLFTPKTAQPASAPAVTTSAIESVEPPKANPFGFLTKPTVSTAEPTEQSKANPFGSLAKPPSPIKESGDKGFSILGAATGAQATTSVSAPSQAGASSAPSFNFGQPSATSNTFHNPFSSQGTPAAQSPTKLNLFSQTPAPTPPSKPTTSLFAQAQTTKPMTASSTSTIFGKPVTAGAPGSILSGPFAPQQNASTTTGGAPSSNVSAPATTSAAPPLVFAPSAFTKPSTSDPASTMPALTGLTPAKPPSSTVIPPPTAAAAPIASGASNTVSMAPIIPKVFGNRLEPGATVRVPTDLQQIVYAVLQNCPAPLDLDEWGKKLWAYKTLQASLNQKYRLLLSSCDEQADWTQLSAWHTKLSYEFKQEIKKIKKEKAAAMGISGTESILSTKRKVPDKTTEDKLAWGEESGTPASKRQHAEDKSNPAPAAGTPAKPPSQTSSVFSSIFSESSKPAASSPLAAPPASIAPEKPATGFQAPSFGTPKTGSEVPAFNAASTSKTTVKPAFEVPKFGAATSQSTTAKIGFEVPKFGSSGTNGGSFFTQFGKTAKTKEQIYEEAKAKAKDEDYDSEDSEGPSYEEWSAEYDRKHAEKNKATTAATFTYSAPSSNASSNAESTSKPTFTLTKPKDDADTAPKSSLFTSSSGGLASGATSNGLFGSRAASPAPSTTGGSSVFDSPHNSQTTANNIFGHLSSGPESNGPDDPSDEDDDAETESVQPVEQSQAENTDHFIPSSSSSKRKASVSGSDDETFEEQMRRKKQAPASIGSGSDLASRLTFPKKPDDKDGSTTPTKPPAFGGFNPSTSLSSSTTFNKGIFAGDQTWKNDSPIKFGQSTNAPSVAVQPSTPSATSIFNFGSPAPTPGGLTPGFPSASNSVFNSPFSSRAQTPASADEASGKDDGDEGQKDPQLEMEAFLELSDEEKAKYESLFVIDKTRVREMLKGEDGKSTYKDIARGALQLLKDKESNKTLLRIRVFPSGNTPVNYYIPPIPCKAMKTYASTPYYVDGKMGTYMIQFRTPQLAEQFSKAYNSNLPA